MVSVVLRERYGRHVQGLVACTIVALAAVFLGDNYGAPVMVFALLLGMSVNFLYDNEECRAGIDFASSTVLRFGVVLLGANILVDDVLSLGWATVVVIIASVAGTIVFGSLAARLLKLDNRLGMLSGGAVAICGISAAMTLSSVMPRNKETEHYTLLTVLMVAAFGAVAMVVYPVVATGLDLKTMAAGLFIGGAIHDVSHVVGASYSISTEVGYSAMVVKMLRVVLLIPATWAFFVFFKQARADGEGNARVALPLFLVGFVAVVIANNLGGIPDAASDAMSTVSRSCFVLAIVALGMKTSLKGLVEIGWRPLVLVLAESGFLGLVVLAWLLQY